MWTQSSSGEETNQENQLHSARFEGVRTGFSSALTKLSGLNGEIKKNKSNK